MSSHHSLWGRSLVVGNLLSKIVIALVMHHITSHHIQYGYLIGFSVINHPFWGTPIFGNTMKNPYTTMHFHQVISFPSSQESFECTTFSKFRNFFVQKKNLLGIPPCHIGIIGKGIQIITHDLSSLPLFPSPSTKSHGNLRAPTHTPQSHPSTPGNKALKADSPP